MGKFSVRNGFHARNGPKHTADPRVYGCVWFVVLSSAYNKSHFVLAVTVADSFAFDKNLSRQ